MKLFSLQARHVLILSFIITISPTSFVSAERYAEKDAKFFESFVQSWNALEHTITEASNYIVEFIEDIFHISDHHSSKFNYDVTLVGFVNFADGIGRHPILFKECLENHVKMNFASTRNIPAEI